MVAKRSSLVVLFLVLSVCRVLATQEKLDPLKHRAARGYVDLNARKEYYQKKLERVKATRYCPTYTPPELPHDLPKVPNSFTTDIEIAFQEFDKQTIIYGQEMYDGEKQRGILNYQFSQMMSNDRPLLLAENIHYNVKRNEVLFVFLNAGCAVTGQENCDTAKNCTSGTLQNLNDELERLFGVATHSGSNGFVGASGILEFGPQFNYTEKMTETCHGLDCHVYETCIYVPEDNATLFYTYYWSTPEWNMVNSGGQVPIAVEIFGDKVVGHTSTTIMRRYDFFNYKREFKPSKFELEPTADTYCFFRNSEFSPPKAVSSFYQHSETVIGVDIPVQPSPNVTFFVRFRVIYPKTEYYDYLMGITRQDFVPIFALGNERRFENKTMLIHDFNQGLAYIIQDRQRYCNITKLGNLTSDVVIGDDGSISMQSPWQIEDLDIDLQYNGNHWERGLDTGVWVGLKPITDHPTETYVWYFASPFTNEISGFNGEKISFPTADHVPVKLEKYITYSSNRPHTYYNVYNYESQVPHTHFHDISLCYESNDMKDLKFDMPENSLNKTRYKKEHLKYALVRALSDTGNVSPLRINRLEIAQVPGALQVVFTLLERSDIIGSVPSAADENTMEQAYTDIKSKLDKSQLIVEVNLGSSNDSPDKVQLVALPNTMQLIQRDSEEVEGTDAPKGHTPGAMAGLGISMVIVGLVIGFLGIFKSSRN